MRSMLECPPGLPLADGKEFFEDILKGDQGLRVERIISHGHTSPEGEWYDQELDEWVVVLMGEAVLALADGREVRLSSGNHIFLPRHMRHRVCYTSSPCIWLAVHGKLAEASP